MTEPVKTINDRYYVWVSAWNRFTNALSRKSRQFIQTKIDDLQIVYVHSRYCYGAHPTIHIVATVHDFIQREYEFVQRH